MEYLKKYHISEEQIEQIGEQYNDGIIDFLTLEKEFIIRKIEYLQSKKLLVFPILMNNIKVFLEEMKPLKEKIERMEKENYSKKAIQMVLMNEQLYDKK